MIDLKLTPRRKVLLWGLVAVLLAWWLWGTWLPFPTKLDRPNAQWIQVVRSCQYDAAGRVDTQTTVLLPMRCAQHSVPDAYETYVLEIECREPALTVREHKKYNLWGTLVAEPRDYQLSAIELAGHAMSRSSMDRKLLAVFCGIEAVERAIENDPLSTMRGN